MIFSTWIDYHYFFLSTFSNILFWLSLDYFYFICKFVNFCLFMLLVNFQKKRKLLLPVEFGRDFLVPRNALWVQIELAAPSERALTISSHQRAALLHVLKVYCLVVVSAFLIVFFLWFISSIFTSILLKHDFYFMLVRSLVE